MIFLNKSIKQTGTNNTIPIIEVIACSREHTGGFNSSFKPKYTTLFPKSVSE
jgi:hypothetical protein